MSALPRGCCSVCGDNVALCKDGTARTHYVRLEDGRLIAANSLSGRPCSGTGKLAKLAHIRVGVVRASPRLMRGRGNPGRTLCGSAISEYDLVWRDAKKFLHFVTCTDCRTRFEEGRAS